MTQAVINIYNNLNEALIKDTSATSNVTKPDDFTKVLDTKIDSEITPMTIGDMKNASNNDSQSIMIDLREAIANATNEAYMENSLDLTLARDIKDIINQLKACLNTNTEAEETVDKEYVDKENVDKEITEQAEEIVITETENSETNTAKDNDNSQAFEQILTAAAQIVVPQLEPLTTEVIAKAEEFVNHTAAKINLNVDTEVLEQETVELATKVLPEGVSNEADETVENTADSVLDNDLLKELNVESIESETNTNNGGEFANKQSAEEYGIKAMIHNTVEAAKVNFENIQTQTVQPKTVEITPDKVMEQIMKHMENLHNGSKVNIVLNPESLGKVSLQVINTKEGLSAQFTVTTQEARELIMKGLDGLKGNLLAHGVNVDNISVKVSETEKESYNQDWTEQEGSRGGNKDQGQPNREEKEKGLFEKTLAKTFEEDGNV